MYPIVRLFEDEGRAREAARALIEEEFPESAIQIIAPASAADEEAAGQPASASQTMLAGFAMGSNPKVISAKQVAACAEALDKGRTLVLVTAPFGTSNFVRATLDEFDPVDTELLTPPKPKGYTYDDRYPISSAFRIPLLTKGTDVMSDFLGAPSISHGRTWMSRVFGENANFRMFGSANVGNKKILGENNLKDRPADFTSSFGLPLLSSNSTPFSSLFGMSPLTRKREGEWTHSFGLPLILRD